MLFAFGTHPVDSIRYDNASEHRPLNGSTIGCNTVTVDKQTNLRQSACHRGMDCEKEGYPSNVGHVFTNGDVVFWRPHLAGVHVVEVDNVRAHYGFHEGGDLRYSRWIGLDASDKVYSLTHIQHIFTACVTAYNLSG